MNNEDAPRMSQQEMFCLRLVGLIARAVSGRVLPLDPPHKKKPIRWSQVQDPNDFSPDAHMEILEEKK
jgi:hypothetical protein